MATTLAFDIYGTLINTEGVLDVLKSQMGDRAEYFSKVWRDKQLEYSFRRGLMNSHVDFSVCTQQALDFASIYTEIPLSDIQKKELMHTYKVLPAFDDVKETLILAKENEFRIFAFSNGSLPAVNGLLKNAGIREYFTGVVSASTASSFKPNPTVYNHFFLTAETNHESSWMVSSNPFDVIGAVSAGMKSVWVQRSKKNVFDPWEIQPTLTITALPELINRVKDQKR